MKYLKILGLAAVSAAALMAFVGAGTASATVLCTTEGIKNGGVTGTTCPEGWAVPAKTKIHAVLEAETHATLTDENGNKVVTCKESTVEGETSNEGSQTETVSGGVTILTFGNCSSPLTGGTCTVATIKGGTLEIHWIEGSHDGTLTSNGATVTTQCTSIFGNIHCLYVTENTHLGRLTGSATTGGTATMDIESAFISQEPTSGLCPAKAFWDAKYLVTTPDVLNVSGET